MLYNSISLLGCSKILIFTHRKELQPEIHLKRFFKLMSDSVFGKTMETIHRRVDIKLITDEKNFQYNYIRKKYNHKAKLLVTDTKSITYVIKTEDVYKDFCSDKDKLDSGEYPGDSI